MQLAYCKTLCEAIKKEQGRTNVKQQQLYHHSGEPMQQRGTLTNFGSFAEENMPLSVLVAFLPHVNVKL
jgi:hypothetical protein